MRRIWLNAFIVAALLTTASVQAEAASKGVVTSLADASSETTINQLQDAGVEWVRLFAPLDHYAPAGVIDRAAATTINNIGRNLHAHGMKLGLVLTGTPSSLSSDPIAAPDPLLWSTIAADWVRQTRDGVDLWEMWNEPDGGGFWRNADTVPSAPAYTRLIQAAYGQIKSADPSSRVFLGGLTGANWPYLEEVYREGGQGYFDGVSVHPDTACNITSPYERAPDIHDQTRTTQWSFLGYREVYKTMEANGDGKKPIIMTESGWSTFPGVCDKGVAAGKKAGGLPEATQALFLQRQYHCLQETPYVESAWWFNLRDTAPYSDSGSASHDYYGLWRHDGSPKPAWERFRAVDTAPLGEPCSDYTLPTLSVSAPAKGSTFAYSLPIKASAQDPGGVARLWLSWEGGSITSWGANEADTIARNFQTEVGGELDWQRAKYLPLGPHKLLLRAADGYGNMAYREIPIVKVAPEDLPKINTRTTIELLRPNGRGVPLVIVQTAPDQPSKLSGVLRVWYQKFVRKAKKKGRWVTAHRYGQDAKRGIFQQRKLDLKGGLRWRVIATYDPKRPPLQISQARSPVFRVH